MWDAARAAGEDEEQFRLIAAVGRGAGLPGLRRATPNSTSRCTAASASPGSTTRICTCAGRWSSAALFGGDAPAADVFERTAAGAARENSLDLPPEAEELRTGIRADAAEIAALDKEAQRDKLIETGYVMPHWPKPWGRAADAVEQLVIEEEFRAAGIKRPDYGITGWVILTLIQHGTPWQIERFVEKALRQDEIWCQLFSEPDAGSDAASIKTRATRVDGGWKINGQKVWTSGAHYCARGLATVRTDPDAPKHAGITTVIVDMKAPEVEVRPLRQITGGSDFNEVFFNDLFVPDEDVVGTPNSGLDGRARDAGQRAGQHRRQRIVLRGAGRPTRAAGRAAPGSVGGRASSGRRCTWPRKHALRLLNLRRAARSVEGAGPGPEGNVTKLKLAEHMVRGRRDHGGAAGSGRRTDRRSRRAGRPDDDGGPRHGDRRRHVGGDPQSDRRADPRHAA